MPDDIMPGAKPIEPETPLERGSDITGINLPSLSDPEPPAPTAPVLEGQVAPSPEAVASAGVVHEKPKRDFQTRINKLTRQRREAEEQNTMLSQQLNLLSQQMEELRKQSRQSVAQPAIAPAGSPMDAFGGGEAQPTQPQAAPLNADDIAGIIAQQLNGYEQQRRNEQAAVVRLQTAQQESFQEALEDVPDLADGRTQAGKLFNQLWAQSPLQSDPNGPFHVAMTVRGLLAGEPGEGVPSRGATEQQKLQATTFAPTPSTTDVPQVGRQQLEQAYVKAMEAYRSGDKQAYVAARKIRGMIDKAQG
jgi:hypothetical protein